jgi:hypothetical protein
MLVYDRKRASIQHRLASMCMPSFRATEDGSEAQSESKINMQESCRMAGILYSNINALGLPATHALL